MLLSFGVHVCTAWPQRDFFDRRFFESLQARICDLDFTALHGPQAVACDVPAKILHLRRASTLKQAPSAWVCVLTQSFLRSVGALATLAVDEAACAEGGADTLLAEFFKIQKLHDRRACEATCSSMGTRHAVVWCLAHNFGDHCM